MSDRILTQHPEGKEGVNIERAKYDVIRATIIAALEQSKTLTFTALMEQAGEQLGDSFDGSIAWYVTTIKLDLEARGLIERVPKSWPQQLRLTGDGKSLAS